MATITRIEAIEQIQKVLKAYACKIYELRHDAECLPPAGKAIIDSYCCNENEEQNLIRQACLRVSFFKNVNNNQLLDFYVVCYGLNEYLGLGVKDLIQVTDVTEDKESFWETFWGALQGEFNEDPSGASILIDMSLNFIPGVGQVLDARDIIACLDKLVLQRRYEEVTVWATLILTAIGCIPYAGDVIKAIGKSIIKEADDIVLMLLKKLDAEDVYSAFIKFYEILQESIEDAIKLIDKWLREAAGRYKESDLGELIRNANGYIKKAWGVIQTKIDNFAQKIFGKESVTAVVDSMKKSPEEILQEAGYKRGKEINDYSAKVKELQKYYTNDELIEVIKKHKNNKKAPKYILDRMLEKNNTPQIDGLFICDGKVDGKVPIDMYKSYRQKSIHNPESNEMTLGKYDVERDSVTGKPIKDADGKLIESETNYIKRAGDTTYFDMGEDWEIQTKEYWLDKRGKQMFKLYNRPAIDDAINSGKQLRFSHDPRNYHDCALEWEWNYIKNKMNIDEFDVDDVLIYREDGFWYVEK